MSSSSREERPATKSEAQEAQDERKRKLSGWKSSPVKSVHESLEDYESKRTLKPVGPREG